MKLKSILCIFLLLFAVFPIFSKKRTVPALSMNDLTDPSSPSYIPYPYPDTEDRIIEDLCYGIKKVFSNDSDTYEYSLEKKSNPLPKLLQRSSGMTIQKIVKVENRMSEMADPFSYLIILLDKETNEYSRVSMTADGLLHGFAVVSSRAKVKPLKDKNEIISLLTNQVEIKKSEISKVDLLAYDIISASPICPFYRLTLKDGSVYFFDYNETIFKKDNEKAVTGDSLSFINKEKARLKKGEDALYDSLDEKLIIIKQLNTGNAE